MKLELFLRGRRLETKRRLFLNGAVLVCIGLAEAFIFSLPFVGHVLALLAALFISVNVFDDIRILQAVRERLR